MTATTPSSEMNSRRCIDYLVCTGEQRWRKFEAERLRGGQVDNKIKFGRLLHRKITRLCAPQNFVNQVSGATE
jgi:hypothetical protein